MLRIKVCFGILHFWILVRTRPQVCFGLMSEDGSCGIVSGADDKSSPKCTPRSGWDGLARPAFDKTGRVCHSPISPILARARQYLDELPDSVDSGGSVADYHEDEESLAEALQSACRSEHSVSLPRMSVARPERAGGIRLHIRHGLITPAPQEALRMDRTQSDHGGGSRPGLGVAERDSSF